MVTLFANYFLNEAVTSLWFLSSNPQMSTTDDQHDIAKVLHGDTKAFAVLVDRYKDLVFTLAMQMVKNREEAEEVSQDAFVKAYKNLSVFKGDAKFSTWLYRITYNTCLDKLKTKKRQQRTVAIDEFTEHHVKTLDSALSHMEEEERSRAIKKSMQLLPDEDGVILTLFYYEELPLKEISKIVNISVNTLKVNSLGAENIWPKYCEGNWNPKK